MIYDSIENYIKYAPDILPGPKELISILNAAASRTFDEIREMDFGGLDLRFGEYETRSEDEVPFEAHRIFWDLQVVMEGEELIGYAPLSSLVMVSEYDGTDDIAFYSGNGQMLKLGKGMMILLSPSDGHRPGIRVGASPSRIRKIVVKLPW